MKIIHDGPPPDGIEKWVKDLKDPRLVFDYTKIVNGHWGHPNRRMMLQETEGDPYDYVLITNDDNQYVKAFWEIFATRCAPDVGMVHCAMMHNYKWCGHYKAVTTEMKVGRIDMGAFIVRLDIAKTVGFNYMVEVADGLYAQECAAYCKTKGLKISYIDKPLFVHN